MQTSRRLAAAVALVFCGLTANFASAAVHTWRVDEIYSNASGSVQFIEMKTNTNGETVFVATGAKLISRSPADVVQGTFNFNHDLAGLTANKTILIGTSNLTSLAGVTPDFVIPAGFLLTGGGELEFFANSFGGTLDIDIFPALPGGILSYSPNTLLTADNTPKNFAGVTGHVVPEPSTLAIALGGLIALGVMGRRFRRRANQFY